MGDTIDKALGLVIRNLSDQNYAESFASYRFWLDIGQTYYRIPPSQIFDVIWNNRAKSSSMDPRSGLIHSTAHLIVRFAGDAESGHAPVPHSPGLQSHLCARSLRELFSNNVATVWSRTDAPGDFYADANFIAHWANLGYVGEAAIRDHILQSLIYQPTLWNHQANALIILFKLAGATFEAYAGPSVVDRCFELLKGRYQTDDPWGENRVKRELIQVRALPEAKGDNRAKLNSQELAALRERGWEGLPAPPVFTVGKPKSAGENQKDLVATPIATSLGLPNKDLELQISQLPPPEPVTIPEPDTIPTSPATPVIQSPSISIATLSDFTIADASDDEFHIDPTVADTPDDEPPIDPTIVTPHEIFYFEDGNVEVLCGNVLFCVHPSILSLHSPAFRRMFAQSNLIAAESPNGCPRILSSDTPRDFATLLKMIYLPGFVAPSAFH